ncbi:hypothetical protein SJA_P2-00300 (plasmid) [Sphingobium indicum UT26S]|uniref:Uncharacterized protein n=1 Tax=Sphingobium indicum (strain DSM 16413 / CCM 7287 / MTCC 6362 / UT26 / NBRC 101211 / UT26S) TaxID=452662 RepID=D4Z9C4_SPHIU|nr:hypothetical protein SJA_P2-00300 [Sphingobium indicum UT26S]
MELCGRGGKRVNSHLPVGRMAERLESLPREHAWFAILVAVTALSWANHAYPSAGLLPLYVPIICAAGWALGVGACNRSSFCSQTAPFPAQIT